MKIKSQIFLKASSPERLEEMMYLFNVHMSESYEFTNINKVGASWYGWVNVWSGQLKRAKEIRAKLEVSDNEQQRQKKIAKVGRRPTKAGV